MKIVIDIIIIGLFVVLVLWTWNNSKDFEKIEQKLIFLIGGILVLSVITSILFSISKIGIEYPNTEIASKIKNMAMLIFIPLNGFLTIPHIASIKSEIEINSSKNNTIKKKIVVLAIIWLTAIIFEIMYLKDFQIGIINMLK